MKRSTNSALLHLLIVFALMLGTTQIASAVGTPSGTQVDNSATLDYTVGGIGQTQIVSNVVSFLVDNRVDLTVTTNDVAPVIVIPGSNNNVLRFTVANTGNTVQDYSLAASPAAGVFWGVTDNFDPNNVRVFVDGNGNGTYEAANDVLTYIDELAADVSIAVFIVADIPLNRVDQDGAIYDLVAQTSWGGVPGTHGADILADDAGIADDPATVQIVFGDGAGSVDPVEDGRFSSRDVYVVGSAILDITKNSTVISDPFNGISNPKAIPGAVIRYTIDVSNTGSSVANAVVVADQIPANTTYQTGSITTSNSNPGATITVEYSADGTNWQNTETIPVSYIRVTNSQVDPTTGNANVSFNATIN